MRGVAYALFEAMGAVRMSRIDDLMAPLDDAGRKSLARLGVRAGVEWLYLPDLLKPRSRAVLATLASIWTLGPIALPAEGATVWRDLPPVSADILAALGFARFEGLALRLDVTERLAAQLRGRARDVGKFDLPGDLAAQAGLRLDELVPVAAGLGFACIVTGDSRQLVRLRRRRRPDPVERKRVAQAGRSDSPFAVLRALVAGGA